MKFDPNTCFVPGCCVGTTEDEPLHEVMSKELDERFRYYATYMNDTELLTKLDCVKSEISHLVCTDVPESSAIRNLSGKTSVSGRKNSEIQTSGATETCE